MRGRGFTLIETLITMALTIFLVLGTSQLMVRALQSQRKSEANLKAAASASSLLEDFKALPTADARLAPGEHEDSVEAGGPGWRFRRRWTVEDISPELKRVVLRTSPELTGLRELTVVFLRSDALGF